MTLAMLESLEAVSDRSRRSGDMSPAVPGRFRGHRSGATILISHPDLHGISQWIQRCYGDTTRTSFSRPPNLQASPPQSQVEDGTFDRSCEATRLRYRSQKANRRAVIAPVPAFLLPVGRARPLRCPAACLCRRCDRRHQRPHRVAHDERLVRRRPGHQPGRKPPCRDAVQRLATYGCRLLGGLAAERRGLGPRCGGSAPP